MIPETVFVQTDPAFNVVLACLRELKQENRLQVTHLQTARLRDIASDDKNDPKRFGGNSKAGAKKAFGRTASAAVRMCMLEAVGIPRTLWPRLADNANRRNKVKLVKQCLIKPLFRLVADKETATRYWSKYDQLYPHFRIEHEVSVVNIGAQASMPSMMLIFRRNFTEVIEITTTFTATPKRNQGFDSYVHVTCIVRNITEDEDAEDGEHTEQLKGLMQSVEIQNEYFEKMTGVKKKEDLKSLPAALRKLEIKDEKDKE